MYGKHLSDAFPIQNGLKQDALSPLSFNSALGYAITEGSRKQEGTRTQ
jgi:hypothetical protein